MAAGRAERCGEAIGVVGRPRRGRRRRRRALRRARVCFARRRGTIRRGIQPAAVARRVHSQRAVPALRERHEVGFEEPLGIAAGAVHEAYQRARAVAAPRDCTAVHEDDGHGVLVALVRLGREHQALHDDPAGPALGREAVLPHEARRGAGAAASQRGAQQTAGLLVGVRSPATGGHGGGFRASGRDPRRPRTQPACRGTRARDATRRDVRRTRGRRHVSGALAPAAELLSADASDRGGTYDKSLTTKKGLGVGAGKGRPGDARARLRYGKDEMNEKMSTTFDYSSVSPSCLWLPRFAFLPCFIWWRRRGARRGSVSERKRNGNRGSVARRRRKNQTATDVFALDASD